MSWPKSNRVRQQPQEAEENKEEPGSQSSFRGLIRLARELGSLPVLSVKPAGLRVAFLAWDTHTQQKGVAAKVAWGW